MDTQAHDVIMQDDADTDAIELGGTTNVEDDEEFLAQIYSKQSFVRDEMRLVLIGKTGSGKSATGNTIAGSKAFVSKLSGSSITDLCTDKMVERWGRHIQIVDTPGLFDTRASNKQVANEIKKCVLMTSPGIHALILVTKIGRFTEEERKTVEHFKKVFGDGLSNYLMIIFTGKDDLEEEETTIQDYIKSAPAALQQLVSLSKNRYMALNNRSSAQEKEAFARQLLDNVDQMVKENGGKCYTSTMFRKAEAIMKKREEEERKRLEEEKRAEREAIENSIKEKYDEVMKDQESQMKNLQTDLELIHKKGEEEQKKHQQALAGLQTQLERAEEERKKIEEDRKKWEEKRKEEMKKNEEDRNKAMLLTMDKMEEDRKARETDMDNRMKQIDAERQQMQDEMRKREEERERKENEQRERMREVEEEKKAELENMRAEQRRQQEEFERRLQEQARNLARGRSRRRRGCSIM